MRPVGSVLEVDQAYKESKTIIVDDCWNESHPGSWDVVTSRCGIAYHNAHIAQGRPLAT